MSDPHGITALLRTAIYDTGGESVEGGFVDRWEPYALTAIDDLERIFTRHGFSRADAERLRAVLREPNDFADAAAVLLARLDRWARPLVEELLTDASPSARAAAARAAGRLLDPSLWLPSLADPDPTVRRAALRGLAEYFRAVPDCADYFRRALEDPDPSVRLEAVRRVSFWRNPTGGEALARRLEIDPDPRVPEAILLHLADGTRRAGVHVGSAAVEEGIGPSVRTALLRGLDHETPGVRHEVSGALRRLSGAEVAGALLDRLEVEPDEAVRADLVMFEDFPAIRERAWPVLTALLASDPNAAVRTRVAFLMQRFGPPAVPLLIAALDDPEARRAAVMTLGNMGDSRALPAVVREIADPANEYFDRELESAIRSLIAQASSEEPRRLAPELSARIQERIDALDNPSWPVRTCKEDFNALPLHGNSAFLWALRPDGQIVSVDFDTVRQSDEPEPDPLVRFAVVLQGARRYPELRDMIPPPPPGTRLCAHCRGTGTDGEPGESCLGCSGLGWTCRPSSPASS